MLSNLNAIKVHIKYGRENFVQTNENMIDEIEKSFPRTNDEEIFVLANRRKDGIKVFKRDSMGYCIYRKVIKRGTVKWIENSEDVDKISKNFLDFCFTELEFVKYISHKKEKIKLL